MNSNKQDVTELLYLIAEVAHGNCGLRPGDDPITAAYRTGQHDALASVANMLDRDYGTIKEALIDYRQRRNLTTNKGD